MLMSVLGSVGSLLAPATPTEVVFVWLGRLLTVGICGGIAYAAAIRRARIPEEVAFYFQQWLFCVGPIIIGLWAICDILMAFGFK
jgi:hypothetical protein